MPAITPQACMSEFAAALIGRDLSLALTLLTDDVVLFYSNGTVVVGKAAFASVMTASWGVVSDYTYSTLDSIWLAQSGDAAAVIYSFAWSGVARDQAVSGSGRGTRVFRRESSGWRIAHEHLSSGQWAGSAT
jgi:ketosteroid isomerase-like protein